MTKFLVVCKHEYINPPPPPEFSAPLNMQYTTIFFYFPFQLPISLEIDCFHSQWAKNICKEGLNCLAAYATRDMHVDYMIGIPIQIHSCR